MSFFFVLWLAGGGPTNPISFSGPFITPITNVGQTQEGYGEGAWVSGIRVDGNLPSVRNEEIRGSVASAESQLGSLQILANKEKIIGVRSPLYGKVTITGGNMAATNIDQEYLTLQVSSSVTNNVTLSGWRIESVATDKRATIGGGSSVPITGTVNENLPIVMQPGERAYLITGESPIGGSFRESICTGYLEDNQPFYPQLNNRCPLPADEFDKHFAGNAYKDNGCYELVRRTNACRTPAETRSISKNCITLINARLTYGGCVASHKYDAYFNTGTWRIYLDRSEITRKNDSTKKYGELWKSSRDAIRLVDENGLTVDLYTY